MLVLNHGAIKGRTLLCSNVDRRQAFTYGVQALERPYKDCLPPYDIAC
jgi:hypothetical protein